MRSLKPYSVTTNSATHKRTKVDRWLSKHKRFYLHFTPTSGSWLNMIERIFHELTDKHIRRGVFQDPEQLIIAIGDYVDRHNES